MRFLVPVGTKEFLARSIGLAIDRSSLDRARYVSVASYTERNRFARSNGIPAPKAYGDNRPFERAPRSFVPIGTKTFWGLEPSPEGLGYCLPSLPGLKSKSDMVPIGTKTFWRLEPNPEGLGYCLPSLAGLEHNAGRGALIFGLGLSLAHRWLIPKMASIRTTWYSLVETFGKLVSRSTNARINDYS